MQSTRARSRSFRVDFKCKSAFVAGSSRATSASPRRNKFRRWKFNLRMSRSSKCLCAREIWRGVESGTWIFFFLRVNIVRIRGNRPSLKKNIFLLDRPRSLFKDRMSRIQSDREKGKERGNGNRWMDREGGGWLIN